MDRQCIRISKIALHKEYRPVAVTHIAAFQSGNVRVIYCRNRGIKFQIVEVRPVPVAIIAVLCGNFREHLCTEGSAIVKNLGINNLAVHNEFQVEFFKFIRKFHGRNHDYRLGLRCFFFLAFRFFRCTFIRCYCFSSSFFCGFFRDDFFCPGKQCDQFIVCNRLCAACVASAVDTRQFLGNKIVFKVCSGIETGNCACILLILRNGHNGIAGNHGAGFTVSILRHTGADDTADVLPTGKGAFGKAVPDGGTADTGNAAHIVSAFAGNRAVRFTLGY